MLDYHSQPTKQKQVVCQVCEDALQNERILSSLSQNGSFQKKNGDVSKKVKKKPSDDTICRKNNYSLFLTSPFFFQKASRCHWH